MRKAVLLGMFAVVGCTGYVGAATDATPAADAAAADARPSPDAQPGIANLVLMGAHTEATLMEEVLEFDETSCSLQEECIDAPGVRRLLRFSTVTANMGTADIFLGAPPADPLPGQPPPKHDLFEWGPCHGHYHFSNYANYELLDSTGVVARGHKQAFCLEDTDQIDPTVEGPNYFCNYQGISAGWADQYHSSLPCQWIDITDVPPGEYTLRLSVNYMQILPESNYDDNVYETTYVID
jgi:hypothetical protein